MSVPSTSHITVRRVAHPGRRFRVDLAARLSRGRAADLGRRLAEGGWRGAWTLLARAGEAPARQRRRTREALDAHLEEALRRASVPARLGVFLGEDDDTEAVTLGPAAALAVLARRSGPLYLPSRPLETSLVDPRPLVLFFPEKPR
jgi:hypothetical protein